MSRLPEVTAGDFERGGKMALARITDELTKSEIYINTNQICFMEQDTDCVDIHMSDQTCFVTKGNMKEIVENIRILEGIAR